MTNIEIIEVTGPDGTTTLTAPGTAWTAEVTPTDRFDCRTVIVMHDGYRIGDACGTSAHRAIDDARRLITRRASA